MGNGAATVEDSLVVPQKVKQSYHGYTVIPPLSTNPSKMKIFSKEKVCKTHILYDSIFMNCPE